jgi:hypothetical protein
MLKSLKRKETGEDRVSMRDLMRYSSNSSNPPNPSNYHSQHRGNPHKE